MEWDSPWGVGFPGWHIECSAMSMKYLGDNFDIHTGGIDHIPVHHTNEIAQSECATGKKNFAQFWMHVEFLTLDQDEKMSKSSGNFMTLDTLKDLNVDRIEYRYYLVTSHYRSKLKFSMKNLEQAQNSFQRLKRNIIQLKKNLSHTNSELSTKAQSYKEKFEGYLANDLDMPNVIANLWSILRDDDLKDFEKYQLALIHDDIIGVGMQSFEEDHLEISEDLNELLEKRNLARKNKNWELSDQLRDQIYGLVYEIVDSKEGSKLIKKS